MKTLSFLIISTAFLYSCMSSGNGKATPEDSLQYYPPTPAPMAKEEYRRLYRTFSAFFDSTLFRSGFNGQVLIAKKGTIVFERNIGFRDLRKKDSLRSDQSLHIASTSKTFTAVAVLRLVQEGRLSLEDSISRFFPTLPYPGITVRMLLNHRSGLPNYVNFMDKTSWNKKVFCSNKDVLEILIHEHPNREASPDRKFSYSNTNYLLLALIIESVTGQPYPAYMKDSLFTPLGMKNTYVFTLADTLTANPTFKANGEYWNFDYLDATYGDKNIFTTTHDLLKWDQALYTTQLLNKTMLDQAFSPYSNERPSIHNYGLGFRLMLLPNGKKIIYHFGRWHGSNAAFARLPEEEATIIILGNRYNRSIYNSAHHAYDLFGEYFHQTGTEEEETDTIPLTKKQQSSYEKGGNKQQKK